MSFKQFERTKTMTSTLHVQNSTLELLKQYYNQSLYAMRQETHVLGLKHIQLEHEGLIALKFAMSKPQKSKFKT